MREAHDNVGAAGRGVKQVQQRKPKRLPAVITCEEVKAGLGNPTGGRWLMASLTDGPGLRLGCLDTK